jgi:predicted RNA binding protein YcfA (HicA-like mRNA interferase family)
MSLPVSKKKGFEEGKNTHHRYYNHRRMDGTLSGVFTYTSHSGKELHDHLLSQMAKQCRLKRDDFLKLVDCSMSREDYEKELKKRV